MTPPAISWQALRDARRLAAERWPSPFDPPLVKRPSDLLYPLLAAGCRVLDVGSGDATRRERVAARAPGATYVSVDTDPASGADHPRVEDAGGGFDVAVLFEVMEHLPPAEAIALLRSAHAALREGGRVVVSVPCTHTPGRYLRDCTHVTPWAHDELGAALILAGFRLDAVHRTYAAAALPRLLRRALLGPVGHLFGLDYAQSVVATGTR